MTQTEPKTKAGKFFQNVLKPIVRAAVKQIPVIGTPIVEIVTNLTQPKDAPKKHSYLSIGVQAAIALIVILDIVLNKGVNLLALIDLVGIFPASEVTEISPVL